jgi:hypothetical protein
MNRTGFVVQFVVISDVGTASIAAATTAIAIAGGGVCAAVICSRFIDIYETRISPNTTSAIISSPPIWRRQNIDEPGAEVAPGGMK